MKRFLLAIIALMMHVDARCQYSIPKLISKIESLKDNELDEYLIENKWQSLPIYRIRTQQIEIFGGCPEFDHFGSCWLLLTKNINDRSNENRIFSRMKKDANSGVYENIFKRGYDSVCIYYYYSGVFEMDKATNSLTIINHRLGCIFKTSNDNTKTITTFIKGQGYKLTGSGNSGIAYTKGESSISINQEDGGLINWYFDQCFQYDDQ